MKSNKDILNALDKIKDMCDCAQFIEDYEQHIRNALQTQAELVEALKFAQFALEPWDDVKPRDWKSDRENLKRAHQKIKQALARTEGIE